METEILERIREHAYQLWEADGCDLGRDMEYWYRAEADVAKSDAVAESKQTDQT